MKDVRPTSGRVISALFSILGGKVEGAEFLDLFAGTGRVGIEAMKRGARSVFVESVKSRADDIRKVTQNPSVGKDDPSVSLRSTSPLTQGRQGQYRAPCKGGEGHEMARGSLVLSLEVRRAVSWLIKREMKFDIIFADPPYNSGWCDTFPAIPNLSALFADDAVIVIEHSAREPLALTVNPNSLEVMSSREYGETCLTFLKML